MVRGRKPKIADLCDKVGGPPSAAPPIPDWLEQDAVEEWNRIVPPLALLGLLTPTDMATLAAYAQSYAMWKKAELQVRKEGLTVRGNHGEIRAHPLIRVCTALLTEIRKIAGEFGFTPAARASLGKHQEPGNADRDEFNRFVDTQQVG